MIEGLEQASKTDLLPLAYVFSAYTLSGENEQQWLIERFNTMKDFLEDNYAYREMVKWAEQKRLKQVVVRFVETHFPDLVLLAKQQAEQAKTPQQLQELLDKLFVAHSNMEAKAALLSEQV